MESTLIVGARERRGINSLHGGWQSMANAPRDGSVIELKCTYGVAPWYGLHRWTTQDGRERWSNAKDDRKSISGEANFLWRPYAGEVDTYVDPTGGLQEDMAYWRGAAASKYGLPLDYFEKSEKRASFSDEHAMYMYVFIAFLVFVGLIGVAVS